MKNPENDKRYSYCDHPVDRLEPQLEDEDHLRALEAFNSAVHWILDAPTLEKVGIKAACLARCCQLEKLPAAGMFKSLETSKSNDMAKKLLIWVLEWILETKTFSQMGARALAAFYSLNLYLKTHKNLTELGDMTASTKQGFFNKQQKFIKRCIVRR